MPGYVEREPSLESVVERFVGASEALGRALLSLESRVSRLELETPVSGSAWPAVGGHERSASVVCPLCRAGVGFRCVRRDGRRADAPHADRLRAFAEAEELRASESGRSTDQPAERDFVSSDEGTEARLIDLEARRVARRDVLDAALGPLTDDDFGVFVEE